MRRLDLAPVLAAAGGLILLISLFLDWYQPGLSAWTVFEVLDLVLAGLAIAALWIAVQHLVLATELRDATLMVVGVVAFVVVVSQLINHPPAAQGGSPQSGAWLALAGSGLMAAGGIMSALHVSLSISLSPRERQPAVSDVPRRRDPSPANEAAAVEPEVQDELYPEQERHGPIGADDPEPWTAAPEDETLPMPGERDERA